LAEGFKELFGDVFTTEGVFKGEPKLVPLREERIAVQGPVALEVSASAIDVDWNVLLELGDIDVPPALGVTVRNHPGNQILTLN
jgi:hypothetical protein